MVRYILDLSKREMDILRRLGYTDSEIACELCIALSTTREYIKRIYSKLSAKNRTSAVIRALKLGVVDVEDMK